MAAAVIVAPNAPTFTRKEDAPCCVAQKDSLGRLPIGFCGPDCIRRLERDTWLSKGRS